MDAFEVVLLDDLDASGAAVIAPVRIGQLVQTPTAGDDEVEVPRDSTNVHIDVLVRMIWR